MNLFDLSVMRRGFFVETFFQTKFLCAFAAATVGGFTSPLGAVVGGFLVGVTENLVGTYVGFIGTELKLTVALAMIIIVLLVKPSGLFGRSSVRRV